MLVGPEVGGLALSVQQRPWLVGIFTARHGWLIGLKFKEMDNLMRTWASWVSSGVQAEAGGAHRFGARWREGA